MSLILEAFIEDFVRYLVSLILVAFPRDFVKYLFESDTGGIYSGLCKILI